MTATILHLPTRPSLALDRLWHTYQDAREPLRTVLFHILENHAAQHGFTLCTGCARPCPPHECDACQETHCTRPHCRALHENGCAAITPNGEPA